jgi:cobalt/nickel transport system permease protein
VASASTLGWALRAERSDPEHVPAGTLGALSAFVFAAQLVNVPLLPGTSGHLVGGMLAAALVGPWRGILVMSVVLAVQALLFQDGGVTAFGTNLLAMGGAGSLGGHAVASLVIRVVPGGGPRRGFRGRRVRGDARGCGRRRPRPGLLGSLPPVGRAPGAALAPRADRSSRGRPHRRHPGDGPALAARPRARPAGRGRSASPAPRPRRPFVALAVAAFLRSLRPGAPGRLESAAERLGFAAAARAVWPAPAPDYVLPWLALGRAGTAVAGVLGALAAAALAWGLSRGTAAPREGRPHR